VIMLGLALHMTGAFDRSRGSTGSRSKSRCIAALVVGPSFSPRPCGHGGCEASDRRQPPLRRLDRSLFCEDDIRPRTPVVGAELN
jgi:hypothetical protein